MLKKNPTRKDKYDPAFFADSIADVVDLSTLESLPYSKPYRPALPDSVRVGITDYNGEGVMDHPRMAWNRYKPNAELLNWWTENVANILGGGEKDPEWGLGSLEIIRQHKATMPKGWKAGDGAWPSEETSQVKVFGKSRNSIASRCLASFEVPVAKA